MFIIYVLDGCPYCNESMYILNKYELPYKRIIVTNNEKNKYKKELSINTFPYIIFETNTKKYIIGGNDNFQDLINRSLKRIQ